MSSTSDAITDTDGTANAVDENASVGTVVGVTALATDPDGSDTVSYTLSDDAGGLFAIDANTGVVTVAGAIDREAAASHDIEVTATSTDGSTSVQSFTIAVNDVDEFNISATSDVDGSANTVSESAAVGTAVGVTALGHGRRCHRHGELQPVVQPRWFLRHRRQYRRRHGGQCAGL